MQFSAEDKIRIVLEGLRGDDSIAALCRKEGIATDLHCTWSKEFMEAGDAARAATIGVAGTLEDASFQVVTMSTCRAALGWLLETKTPTLAILDIGLRDGSCEAVATRLVELGVPFVVHSGQVEGDYRNTVFANGIWAGKPASSQSLVSIAHELTAA